MSVLGAVGAAAGFFLGGPAGAAMGYSVGSGVDALVNAPDRIGPRLEDLRVQLSQYGAMVPFEWGTNRHAGTIIWPRILEAVEHREEESSKGGPETVTFKYTLSCAVLLCEGPIAGVRRIWANKKIVYDVSESNTGPTQDPRVGSIRFHLGTEDQLMDPLIEATDGPGPAYRGYAYVVFEDYDVTDLAGRPPQWEFEVITAGNNDIPETTSFGEKYDLSIPGGAVFSSDMDSNGHLWISTMKGRAWTNPETGMPEVDPYRPGIPQIQEYDAATGELLWFYNVPAIYEKWSPDQPPVEVYPIKGTGICSGGYYFVGRGHAGWPSNGTTSSPSYVHATAVNMQTHVVTTLFNQCSSGQFNNAGYWPSVPVPVIENNKVFFVGSTGAKLGFGVGFMPASIANGNGVLDYDPAPDYSGSEPIWTAPAGWAQARVKAPCPIREPGGPSPSFDGVPIELPGWAYRSTVIHNPEGVIVQGEAGSSGTYLALLTNPVRVTGFDLTPPDVVFCALNGDPSAMPAVVWDEARQTIWAFIGPERNELYAITPGNVVSTNPQNGLVPTFTGFALEEAGEGINTNGVRGMTIDTATGLLRVVVGFADARILLIDPVAGTVVSESPITIPIQAREGEVWDMPGTNSVVFSNGFQTLRIPYGAALAPTGIPLSQIVRDICLRSGLTDNDIDVSELTDSVDGYIVPRQMTARAAIEPLQQAFFFDAVESDNKIKFVKRGAASATLIPVEDRAAREHGQDVPDALTVTRAFEYELPVQCDVEYPDIEADHLIGNQVDKRITKDTRHNMNVQLPIVMTAERAKSIARTLLYEAWQNQSFKFSTSRKYAHLEPTSLVELPTASAMYRGRITAKREQPNGIINWEARVDSVEVYTQTGEGAVPIGHVPQQIFQPTTTQLAMLDIPMLRDEDDNAGFYVAMGAL